MNPPATIAAVFSMPANRPAHVMPAPSQPATAPSDA